MNRERVLDRQGGAIRAGAVPLILFWSIACLAAAFSGCTQPAGETGTLTGNVSIGPLCPVEPCTLSADRIAAAYAARPIRVTDSAGRPVLTFTADPDTGYAVRLDPGTYTVDIPHPGIGGSRDLPVTVTIRSGEMVRLNIAIDTGIR